MFNKKGFTLIELLIVIGIIAILAAALIVGLNPAERFTQARNATRWSHLNGMANQVMAYMVDEQGNFPACITGTEITTPPGSLDGALLSDCDVALGVDAPDDPGDGAYRIGWITEDSQFIIWSTAQEALDAEVWVIQ